MLSAHDRPAASPRRPGGRLEVAGLTVTFGGVLALDRVDLDVEAGSITGLIGPNGAGKTTFIDAVTGFVEPRHGSVRVERRPLDGLAPSARAAAGLVRTFQSLELFEDLTVADNLSVAAEPQPWWGALADALGRSRPASSARDVAWALDLMGLGDVADALPSSLSHGRRRLVSVARALAPRPGVVLLDEPAAGLDTDETALLGEHLARLPAAGISVLLVDHDMSLVLGLCTRLHVLDFGRVIARGRPDEVRDDPAVVAAYLGADG